MVSPDGNNNADISHPPPRPVPSPVGISRQSVSFSDVQGVHNSVAANTRGGSTKPSRPPPAVPAETPLRVTRSSDGDMGATGLFSTPQTGSLPAAPPHFKIQSGNFHAPRSAVLVPTKSIGADAAVFAHRSSPTQLPGSTDRPGASPPGSAPNKWALTSTPSSMSPAATDDIQVRLSRANDLLGAFSLGASSGSPLGRLAERQQRSRTPMSMHFVSQGAGLAPAAPPITMGSVIATAVNKVPVAIGSRALSSSPSPHSDPLSRAPLGAPINATQFLSNLKLHQQSQASEVPESSFVRSPQLASGTPPSVSLGEGSLLLQQASKGRFSYK